MYANKMVDTTWYNTSGDIWSAQVSPIPNRTQMGLSRNWVPNFSTASSSFSLIYFSSVFSCYFHLGDISNLNPNHPNHPNLNPNHPNRNPNHPNRNPYCPCLHPIKECQIFTPPDAAWTFFDVSTFARGTCGIGSVGGPRFIQVFMDKIMGKSSGWWFEPLWKILVNWDDYSQYMGK